MRSKSKRALIHLYKDFEIKNGKIFLVSSRLKDVIRNDSADAVLFKKVCQHEV